MFSWNTYACTKLKKGFEKEKGLAKQKKLQKSQTYVKYVWCQTFFAYSYQQNIKQKTKTFRLNIIKGLFL